MKKILLDSKKNYYKANLHCHSTVSDGVKTPEELKKMYMEKGYSIIAYTDHNVLIDHSNLCDENFLALNGYEADIAQWEIEMSCLRKDCHLCYISLSPNNLTQVCFHRSKYLYANAQKYAKEVKFDETKPDFERVYTAECINKMIEEGRKNNFFVTYNHPTWSMENLEQYGKYKGMHAMEIFNYGCFEAGFEEYNPKEYDDMLRGGQKIFCIATDDNHNQRNDSFGGFTFINAEKLDYETIADALLKGNFYASQKPEIYELWYENGKIGIECSPAAKITITKGLRGTGVEYKKGDEPLTSAIFDINELDNYVRITVTDVNGNHANTNAYFVKDLQND